MSQSLGYSPAGSRREAATPKASGLMEVRQYNEYMLAAGDWGFYQKACTAACFLGAAVAGCHVMAMYYVHLPLHVECLDHNVTCASLHVPDLEDYCNAEQSFEAQGFGLAGPDSIVKDWDLACGDKYLISIADSLFFVGWFVGGLVSGTVVDTYGRRIPLFAFTLLASGALAATALSPNIEVHIGLKFLHGLFLGPLFLSNYVYGSENVPEHKAAFFGTIFFMVSAAGCALLAILAWQVQQWRTFTLIMAGFTVPFAAAPLVFLESPPFLYSQALLLLAQHVASQSRRHDRRSDDGKASTAISHYNMQSCQAFDRFDAAMRRIAAANGRSEEYDAFVRNCNCEAATADCGQSTTSHATQPAAPSPLEETRKLLAASGCKSYGADDATSPKGSCPSSRRTSFAGHAPTVPQEDATGCCGRGLPGLIRRSPKVGRHLVGMFLVWMSTSLCYFGLSLSGATIPGDVYFNAAALSVLEMCVYPIQLYVIDYKYIGRKGTTLLSLGIGAACCVVSSMTGVIGDDVKWAAFAGNFFLTAAFTTSYIWAAEVFPSEVRATAMGVCTAGGKCGSISTPFLLQLGQSNLPLAMQGFAVVAGIGLFGALLLPETVAGSEYAALQDGSSCDGDEQEAACSELGDQETRLDGSAGSAGGEACHTLSIRSTYPPRGKSQSNILKPRPTTMTKAMESSMVSFPTGTYPLVMPFSRKQVSAFLPAEQVDPLASTGTAVWRESTGEWSAAPVTENGKRKSTQLLRYSKRSSFGHPFMNG